MRKPWNRVSLPVYSISSSDGENHNMHICTYVSAVSMEPKQYMVAVYHGTKTLDLITANPRFLLQLLSVEQYALVRLLGQQSGHKVDKISRLLKRGIIEKHLDFYRLKEALAVVELEQVSRVAGGDHDIFICKVISHQNMHEGEALTTGVLRDKKIIRA
jgi:flavin reductase (DIM6/NTAB) family NADH-FMN oxidoreductase RutF